MIANFETLNPPDSHDEDEYDDGGLDQLVGTDQAVLVFLPGLALQRGLARHCHKRNIYL